MNKQNFPPVVPESFALLGFAEIDKNDDMGLLWILESIGSKSESLQYFQIVVKCRIWGKI